MQKNTAGKWIVFAYGLPDHANDGQPITGDALNITGDIHIDGAAANDIDDTNPAEIGGGYYVFDITAAEANGDNLVIVPVSATANVQVIGVPGAVWTRPPNFEALGIESDGDLTKCNLVATTTTNTDMLLASAIVSSGTALNTTGGTLDLVTDVTTKTGFSLSTAGVLAIWDQATSALTTAGRIGKLLVDNVNATISSRMPTTHIDATAGTVDNVTLTDTTTTLTTKTGFSLSSTGADLILATSTFAAAMADGLLNRDMSTGTDSGSATVRTVRQALRFLRNKWSISGTTMTVTAEDDTTASWTAELTTNASADPVTASDPASS